MLNHLLYLALAHGYASAGRVILNPEKYGLSIGVETSEGIEGTYVVPLIRGYMDLNELIDTKDFERIARRICSWSAENYSFRVANDLIANLKKRRYQPLATTLSATCTKKKVLMKKHGEKFAE